MRKTCKFLDFKTEGWPSLEELRPYFMAPKGKEWFPRDRSDEASFLIEGAEGVAGLKTDEGRLDISLDICGVPGLGAMLLYSRIGTADGVFYVSKGDPSRMRQFVRTVYDDLRPVGVFIPFAEAWKAVKAFIETDGQGFPRSIEWIDRRTLSKDCFPDPHDDVDVIEIPTP